MARLQNHYKDTVVPAMVEKFGYKSVMEVPRIEKITLNMGVGEAVGDKKNMEFAVNDMQAIAGQKPIVTKARKSVAGFKIREGYPVGCKVTLRKNNMYFFLDKLITLAIPRVKDFRGIKANAFDGRGNFAMGLQEQVVFPEIDAAKIEQSEVHGMNITISMSGGSNEQSKFLLQELGMPFAKESKTKKTCHTTPSNE